MKKFISMVMAAAMVVSLVPATAFAATGEVVADSVKIVDTLEKVEDFKTGTVEGLVKYDEAPEVQIKLDSAWIADTTQAIVQDITFELDNADFSNASGTVLSDLSETNAAAAMANKLEVRVKDSTVTDTINVGVKEVDDTEVTYTLTGSLAAWENVKVIAFDVQAVVDNTDAGSVATVSVTSDIVDADKADMVFVEILETGVEATIKEATEIAEESEKLIEKKIEIESDIDTFVAGQVIEMKLSSGFEFVSMVTGDLQMVDMDEDEATFVVVNGGDKDLVIAKDTLKIEAVDAKAGDEATLTIKVKDATWNSTNKETVKNTNLWDAKAEGIVIAVVLGDEVLVSVDEDEDVPVYYSGVNADNGGITEKDTHTTLVVTLEESVEDAWDLKDAWEINLPDGVYVVGMDVKTVEGIATAAGDANAKATVKAAFEKAYDKADFKGFEFSRKSLVEADNDDSVKTKIEFELELVADPGFVGDVALEVVIDDAAKEVVVANFTTPYVVEAAQNDVVIDYRFTEVSDIVVKETEAGLWEKGLAVAFGIERLGNILEDEVDLDVNEESDMDVKEVGYAGFKVTAESDDEAAVVTLSNVSLYMDRTIAAGAYDLKAVVTDKDNDVYGDDLLLGCTANTTGDKYVADVTDAEGVVKEAYINVITAGRDADDASFTTKVVVPVGESYIVAGEQTVALDVPAYVSAAGYTMLPVRAVAVALGILNNNVLWDQATKTVTILYGQRIITMQVGAKVVYVNGSAIPASASPEVVDGRTFLPMRDLATALGVTDITWDAATKTATLNGNK